MEERKMMWALMSNDVARCVPPGKKACSWQGLATLACQIIVPGVPHAERADPCRSCPPRGQESSGRWSATMWPDALVHFP